MSATENKWTLKGFKRYRELHRRNYELDNLWGADERPSAEYCEFIDLEQTYSGTDNVGVLLDLLDLADKEVDRLRTNLFLMSENSIKWQQRHDRLQVIVNAAKEHVLEEAGVTTWQSIEATK